MFYFKDDHGVLHELHDENIVTHCPVCCREITADLSDMGPDWGWYDTCLFCGEACVKKWKASQASKALGESHIIRLYDREN